MRKGVTPVVATVLLITITIGAAGTFYTVVSDQQQKVQDNSRTIELDLDNLRVENCYVESGETNMVVRNNGRESINVSQTSLLVNNVIENNFEVRKELVDPQGVFEINVDYRLGRGDSFTIISGDDRLEYLCRDLNDLSTISNWGLGVNGDRTVTTETVVNDYTYLASNASSGETQISVNDGSKFSANDQILLLQTQQGREPGQGGQYEFHRINSILGDTLELEDSMENSYYSGVFADNPESLGEVTQVIRVPEYESLTIDGGEITSKEWNGKTGGVVALRATEKIKFINGGNINVTGAGFRGGTCGNCGDDWDGGKGEGTQGWQKGGGTKDYADEVSLNNGIGGGGSHVNNNNGGDPAAGGGHATEGETVIDSESSYQSEGGDSIGTPTLSKMYFGGGGGAGSDNDGQTPYPESRDGGGIAFIAAKNMEDVEVYAKGEPGLTSMDSWVAGNAGAGAGGSIYLASEDIGINKINASGGSRSREHPNDQGEKGGYGGDGRIRIDYSYIAGSSNTDPEIGYEGELS